MENSVVDLKARCFSKNEKHNRLDDVLAKTTVNSFEEKSLKCSYCG